MIKFVCNSCDGKYDSLDVRFTKKCDNRCSFCIERTGASSFGETKVEELIRATKASGIKDVLILGGEPFLYPDKLLAYVIGIRDYANKIYITTSLPATFLNNRTVINSIIDNIDGLNVSLQSVNWGVNNIILNATSNHNRIEILKDLTYNYSDKLRVSINLTRGGVDSQSKLRYALSNLRYLGVKYVKINELQGAEVNYISFEYIMGCKLPSPYAHGCYTYIDTKLYDLGEYDLQVMLKRSCFMVNPDLRPAWSDLFKLASKLVWEKPNKFLVLYEDGSQSRSWLNL